MWKAVELQSVSPVGHPDDALRWVLVDEFGRGRLGFFDSEYEATQYAREIGSE